MTEIHEFAPRYARRRQEGDAAANPAAENLSSLIGRVSGASIHEVDQVILELQAVRDMLAREGERLRDEITRYATLNQHLMTAMKVIAENVQRWKGESVNREQALADFKSRWLGGDMPP